MSGFNRRSVVFGGASALAAGVLTGRGFRSVMAQESSGTPAAGETEKSGKGKVLRQKMEEYGFQWSATSPATHLGDAYSLTARNTGSATVRLWVSTIVMDHKQHHNEFVVEEDIELATGAEQVLTANNNYGTANHFSTRIATDAPDTTALALMVTILDSAGEEAATFNQRAFMITSFDELKARAEARVAEGTERRKKRRENRHEGEDEGTHGHHGLEAEGTPDS